MNTTRINHWHRHYRVREPHVLGWERLASEAVLVAFETAITDVVPDEREVVLLRKVALRFTAKEPGESQRELAEQWGRATATAVKEAIARNDPANVRRFPDVEEHLICYLQALVSRHEADAWYFARLRSGEDRMCAGGDAAIDSVRERHLDLWPEVLARLSERGLFQSVLRRVSPPLLQRLWSQGVRGLTVTADPESERPVFAAALQSVAQICGRQFSSAESRGAFQAHVARPRPATDWSDATHLAEAVYAAVRFVLDRFSLALDNAAEAVESTATRVDAVVQTFDWLDREWLQRRLVAHATRARQSVPASSTTVDRAGSPKLAVWEQSWRGVESRFLSECDPTAPASPGNCLLALSLIVEHHAAWVHDPALPAFVERMLTQLEAKAARHPAGQSQSRRWNGDRPEVRAPRSVRPLRPTTEERAAAGGIEAVASLAGLAADGRQLNSEFAESFLLARGLHDLRVSGMIRQTAFPNSTPAASARLLAELACLWNQRSFPEEVDPGRLEFARLYSPVDWNELTQCDVTADDATCQRFQSQLSRTRVGLGTWAAPSRLHILVQETSDGCWLLGGDAEGRVFPWSVPTGDAHRIEHAIEFWRDEMSRGSDQPVELLMDEAARSCAGRVGRTATVWQPVESPPLWASGSSRSSDSVGEATLRATAACVLRHWARSLRGRGASSNGFLLEQLIRRSGTISVRPRQIDVRLPPRPMDAVLQVLGMFEPLEFFNGRARGGCRTVGHTAELDRLDGSSLPAGPAARGRASVERCDGDR